MLCKLTDELDWIKIEANSIDYKDEFKSFAVQYEREFGIRFAREWPVKNPKRPHRPRQGNLHGWMERPDAMIAVPDHSCGHQETSSNRGQPVRQAAWLLCTWQCSSLSLLRTTTLRDIACNLTESGWWRCVLDQRDKPANVSRY